VKGSVLIIQETGDPGPSAEALADAEELAARTGAMVVLGLGPDLPLPDSDSAALRKAPAKVVKLQ
jgi:hypothetical protein